MSKLKLLKKYYSDNIMAECDFDKEWLSDFENWLNSLTNIELITLLDEIETF